MSWASGIEKKSPEQRALDILRESSAAKLLRLEGFENRIVGHQVGYEVPEDVLYREVMDYMGICKDVRSQQGDDTSFQARLDAADDLSQSFQNVVRDMLVRRLKSIAVTTSPEEGKTVLETFSQKYLGGAVGDIIAQDGIVELNQYEGVKQEIDRLATRMAAELDGTVKNLASCRNV